MSIYGGGFGSVETVTANGSESASVTSADVTGNTNMLILGGKILVSSYWDMQARTWSPANIVNGVIYPPQYDHKAKKFQVDHNVYAGGNVACIVGNNTYLSMQKALSTKTPRWWLDVTPARIFCEQRVAGNLQQNRHAAIQRVRRRIR